MKSVLVRVDDSTLSSGGVPVPVPGESPELADSGE